MPGPDPLEALRDTVGAMQAMREQIEQMRGMFPDADGTIAEACDAHDDAAQSAREALASLPRAPGETEAGNAAQAEALHVEMLALRDEAAQAVALLDTYNAENSLEHTHNPATPLDLGDPADARIIQALRDGHGTRWGIRLVELDGMLGAEPDETTDAGQALFSHARQMGQIARGEIDEADAEALH